MATLSNDRPVTPLRQRMLDDMAVRGLGEHTRRDYVSHVRRFAAFLERSLDTATPEDVRRFQVHQNGERCDGFDDEQRGIGEVGIAGRDPHPLLAFYDQIAPQLQLSVGACLAQHADPLSPSVEAMP